MALESLRKQFAVSIGGGEAAIRVNTDEIYDAVETIVEVCKEYKWRVKVWDIVDGSVWRNGAPQQQAPQQQTPGPAALNQAGPRGPAQELASFRAEPPVVTPGDGPDDAAEIVPTILVLKNFHLAFATERATASALVQHLVSDKLGQLPCYKANQAIFQDAGLEPETDTGKFIVGLMPAQEKLPPEVDPLFKVIDHELPDEEELMKILDGIASEREDPLELRKRACKSALGLTRLQAEGVFAACVVKTGDIDPIYVWQQKAAILNKEGLIEIYHGTEKFKDIAGLAGAKSLIRKLLASDATDDADPDCRAKGILLVGGPGVGKSLIAKAAGNEMGILPVLCNPGNLMGGYVGDSESKTRKFFQTLRVLAPVVAIIDEIEKTMPKSKGGDRDSGVGARMEGNFLTALNDIQEPIFWAFTANDVQNMHEAFFRAERVDAVFYVGLPNAVQRAAVWDLYIKKFFPAFIGEEPFDRHLERNFTTLEEAYRKDKKKDAGEWAHAFAAALMCQAGSLREAAIDVIAEFADDVDLIPAIHKCLVNDEGWTPAEIRACCRLSRRLKEPLSATCKRIRPVSISASGAIERLEHWASESALDAETGELYVGPPVARDIEGQSAMDAIVGKGQRRKIRPTK